MLSKKYQYAYPNTYQKEGKKSSFSLYIKIGLIAFLLLSLLTLLASNLYFLQYYKENKVLKEYISKTEVSLNEKHLEFMSLLNDLESVKENLSRIQQVNAKLSLMANIEEVPTATSIGGASQIELGTIPLYRQEMASGKIRVFLKELELEAKLEEIEQQEILLAMRENIHILTSLPTVMPAKGFITSNFGIRKSPFTDRQELHKGMDIAAPIGTPIISPGDGVVVRVSTGGSYGNLVEISHGSGLSTLYAHMHKISVKKGQKLKRYDVIGSIGNTGRSTGPHLHYEVRLNGVPTDPRLYILSSKN